MRLFENALPQFGGQVVGNRQHAIEQSMAFSVHASLGVTAVFEHDVLDFVERADELRDCFPLRLFHSPRMPVDSGAVAW